MKKLKYLFNLLIFIPTLTYSQADTSAKQAQLEFDTSFILKSNNEVLFQLTAPSQHHFNLDAPNKVLWIQGSATEAINLEKKSTKIFGSIKPATKQQGLRATLYVCDDANTYCVPKTKEMSLAQAFEPQKKIAKINSTPILDTTPDKATADIIKRQSQDSLNAENEKDWIIDNVEKAFKLAQQKKRPLFIDFYGIWCPPCNVMDATFFKTKKFNPYKNKFILLKLDADKSTSWTLKQRYKIKGYPTYILATYTGDEIHRIVGSGNIDNITTQIDLALKYKNLSLEKRMTLAKNKSKDADFLQDIALNLYNLERYSEADQFFKQVAVLTKKPSKKYECKAYKSDQFTQLKSFAEEQKKEKLNHLITQILAAPICTEVLELNDEAQNLAEELSDKVLSEKLLAASILFTENLLKNKERLTADDYTETDVNLALAELYEKNKEQDKANLFFPKTVQLADNEIKLGTVASDKERGINLTKAYALNKLGKFDESEKIYQGLIKNYPSEFTYYNSFAGALKEKGDLQAAIQQYKKSMEYAYGDNKLRVAGSLAKLLIDTKNLDEARTLLDSTINEASLPDDKDIRTHTYYNKLVKMKNSLNK